MARGGARSGTPGKSYGNRQDLNQAVKVATGEPYGVAQQLENAQRAIPLPNSAATPASPAAAPAPVDAGPPALPGQSPFDRPTERPQEPVTAGLPSGPGPGPEILASAPPDLIGAQLRTLFARYPNDDLLRVMALHEQGK